MDLDALPEPSLAISDTASGLSGHPNNLLRHRASADSPDAEDAIPDAVGNEFTDVILNFDLSNIYKSWL